MGDQKKMYAGYQIWSEGKWQIDEHGNPLPDEKTGQPRDIFTASGIPAIKSDAAPITRETGLSVLKALLNGATPSEIEAYVRSVYDGVMSGEVPIDMVIKAITLGDDPESPHTEQTYIVKGASTGKRCTTSSTSLARRCA